MLEMRQRHGLQTRAARMMLPGSSGGRRIRISSTSSSNNGGGILLLLASTWSWPGTIWFYLGRGEVEMIHEERVTIDLFWFACPPFGPTTYVLPCHGPCMLHRRYELVGLKVRPDLLYLSLGLLGYICSGLQTKLN